MAEDKKQDVILTEREVWDIVEFARNINGGSLFPSLGYITPELLSSRMKDINLNPSQATQSRLNSAMQSPKENETNLRSFSQDFELRSMVYKRLLSYLGNMLAFDVTYTSDAELKHFDTPRYQDDLEKVENFLDNFDYKSEFNIVVKEMLRNDAYFGVIRKTNNGYLLQELPADYCKITGKWKNGYLFSFDMSWFTQSGVDIRLYPDFFYKKYQEYYRKNTAQSEYNPATRLGMRGLSTWVYWIDIPVDLGVCFKLTPELATRLPYFTPLFNDLILQDLMRNLQKNLNMAAASRMIIGQVPMLNRDKTQAVRDSIAISPDLLGKFMALVKSAISDAIKVASAPLEDMKPVEFESDNDMYDKYLRTALASSGINTNLIFSSSVKPNVIETQLSLDVDEQMMTSLYPQFNSFLNYHANKLTSHFKFNFEFEGTNFFTNRKERFERAISLFDKGIVMPQKIAASIGMKPSIMKKHMMEAKANGFVESLTPPTVEQQKQVIKISKESQMRAMETQQKQQIQQEEEGEAGRPKKDISELGEEGMKTLETGANIGRGGKV